MANPNSTEISLDRAFREATSALGEAVVRERLLTARIAELEAHIQASAPTDTKDPS